MHAMLLAGLLLLLGVRGTAGNRASGGDFMISESLAKRRQLLSQLGVVGKARLKEAKCEAGAEVRDGVPTVVMLSGTGEGKSTTTCVIAGDPALAHVAEETKADSETSKSCIHRASWYSPYDHSEPLYLIDTPGFGDTRGPEFIKHNNDDIVKTLRGVGHAHAILWVLNSGDPKMSKGRQDAFRFVRSYFGKDIYKHIVFVYTRYSWIKKGRKKAKGGGNARMEALMLHHHNTMEALLDVVETEFWPNSKVDQGVNDTIMQLPFFGFNTHAVDLSEEEGGSMMFEDNDIDVYNENDPDGSGGVFNPETFKKVTPNSATQLQDLKAKILEISKKPPVDLTNLRPFQDGCKAALKDTVMTDPVVFGQHVTDCVEGQQFKLLKDEVVPYVNGLQDGPVYAAFCINAYTGERGPTGSSLKIEAMKELGIPDPARENAEAFVSFAAYLSCRNADRSQKEDKLAKSLSTCLGGIARGDGTPALVEAMKQRFFSKEAKSSMTSAYITQVVAEIDKLPKHERATVFEHMDFQSLLSRWVQFAIRSLHGFDLGSSRVQLTPSTTLASIINGKVYKLPVVQMLQKQGWIDDVSLLASDESSLISDEDLQHQIAEILSVEVKASPSVALVAVVTWKDKSPPKRLDPQLLKICLDAHSPLAAEALLKDHVTNPKVLVFASDLREVMMNTANYGSVLEGIQKLRGVEVESFKNDTKDETTKRKEDRASIVDKVGKTRQLLQPYLDEVIADTGASTEEATQLQTEMRAKVNKILSEVQASNVLNLPAAVPSQATSEELSAFTAKLDEELRRMEDMTKGKEILGVEDLIWQSRVLKGVYIGQDIEEKASELIQITKMPAPMSILTPPASSKRKMEMTSRSATTISSAKKILHKGGESFAGSLSVSGAGMGNWGVGAVHMAGKVSSTMEEEKEINTKGRVETQSFHSLRTVIHPMRLLELGGKNLRLTSRFLAGIARILRKEESKWTLEIESLFSKFGTHYCPSVELGGIYISEAKFSSSKSFSDAEAKNAMAKCNSAELEAGGGAFFGGGFVTASGSARSEGCKANSSGESKRTQEMMSSTSITKDCISAMDKCPANEDVFINGLRVNSNWAPIDRTMSKCVAVWDELKSTEYLDDLLQVASDPPSGRAAHTEAPTEASVDALLDLMEKVWHLRALNLPQLCKTVRGDNDVECEEMAAVSGNAIKLIAMPSSKIKNLWDKVKERSDELLETSRQCSALNWCNVQHGRGECKQHQMSEMGSRVTTCECKPTWGGDFCGDKIETKKCTKWRSTDCTIHGGQAGCETLWDMRYEYDNWAYCSAVGMSGGISGRYYYCKKTYDCQPLTEGQECCGSLEKGERWFK